MLMEMVKPDSHMESIGYNPADGSLRIKFKNSSTLYEHTAVEYEDYENLKTDNNPGKYYTAVIKKRYPDFRKLVAHNGVNGTGYVIEESRAATRGVGPGYCPNCKESATGYIPPVQDHLYVQAVSRIKEIANIIGDEDAHSALLKRNGGYIETCSACTTTFFVPATVAKIISK